jgi:hypothetical protein
MAEGRVQGDVSTKAGADAILSQVEARVDVVSAIYTRLPVETAHNLSWTPWSIVLASLYPLKDPMTMLMTVGEAFAASGGQLTGSGHSLRSALAGGRVSRCRRAGSDCSDDWTRTNSVNVNGGDHRSL